MASRKEQKEAARERRLAEEAAAAERARRRRRMQMFGGVLVVAVAVIAVAIAISAGSGGSAPVKLHSKKANSIDQQVSSELAGIPQSGPELGNPKAPVTMYYFGDLKCPVCQAFTLGLASGGLPQLINNDVRQGKVKVVYKAYCTATCNGPAPGEFQTQQVAALSAGLQNKFWNFAEIFYREQQSETQAYVTTSFLNGLAEQVPGLNLSKWRTDLKDPSLLATVEADNTLATKDGVTGTPTLIMSGPKGEKIAGTGVLTYGQLESTIKQVA